MSAVIASFASFFIGFLVCALFGFRNYDKGYQDGYTKGFKDGEIGQPIID